MPRLSATRLDDAIINEILQALRNADPTTFNGQFVMEADHSAITFGGTFGSYQNGIPRTGTITSIEWYTDNGRAIQMYELNIDVAAFFAAVNSNSLASFIDVVFSHPAGADSATGLTINGTFDVVDILHGYGGNDTISGSNSGNTFYGGAGNDVLLGGLGNDTLYGEDGNDVFGLIPGNPGIGAPVGNDIFNGGAGADLVSYYNVLYNYQGVGANVSLLLTAAQNTNFGMQTFVSIESVYGTPYADILRGDANANTLWGLGSGNDQFYGEGGNDLIIVSQGSGSGTVIADGGDGVDGIRFASSNSFHGGVTFSLELQGQVQNLPSGSVLASNFEFIDGSVVADVLTGDAAVNQIRAGSGNDRIDGRAGDDFLSGDGGDDLVVGGLGADLMLGGLGSDTFVFASAAESTTGSSDTINDFLSGADKLDLRVLDFGSVSTTFDGTYTIVTGTQGATAFYLKVKGALAQTDMLLTTTAPTINGAEGPDTLIGTANGEAINGLGGDDILRGGGGADTLNGGAGFDFADFSDMTAPVVVDLSAGATVTATIGGVAADTLTAIEGVIGGSGDDTLTGDAGANRLYGGAGADRLNGGAGDDILRGGAGADILDGGDGVDTADFSDQTERVLVQLDPAGSQAEVGIRADDRLVRIENLIGTAFNDTMGGDAGVNRLEGGGGNDKLYGGRGADSLFGGDGDDIIGFSVNQDTANADRGYIDGGAGYDTLSAEHSLASALRISTEGGVAVLWVGAQYYNFTGIEEIVGSSHDDVLVFDSLTSAVTLSGRDGADVIGGGDGADHLYGGLGDDVIYVGAGDVIDGGAGFDTADFGRLSAAISATVGEAGSATIGSGSAQLVSIENLAGTAFSDTLAGDAGANRLDGRDGADRLSGGAGRDLLIGAAGDDQLDGGVGEDTAQFSAARSAYTVQVSGPTVTVTGPDGVDTLTNVEWLRFSDVWVFVEPDGVLTEIATFNETNDTVGGTEGVDHLHGLGGNDLLRGYGGVDYLYGEAGNDILDGGLGADRMAGGLGDDSYSVENAADVIVEWLDEGTDTVKTNLDGYVLGANVENITLTGSGNTTATGNDLNNVMIGNGGNNTLNSGKGDDQLYGGAGDDILNSGTGADRMYGGAGNDIYYYGVGDTIIEAADAGIDTVYASVNFTIGSTLENLVLIGDRAINGTGNNLGNRMQGNDQANVLQGGRGNDALYGQGGDDILIGGRDADTLGGGAGADTFRFDVMTDSLVAGADTIIDYQAGLDRLDLSRLDADTATAGDQAFHQVAAFTHHAGELTLSFDAGTNRTTLSLDINGDGNADMAVLFVGNVNSTSGWLL